MSALTVADVLERAADLIEPEGAWARGAMARNAQGQVTNLGEFRGPATCWCIMGATARVAGDDGYDVSCEADAAVQRMLSCHDLGDWNDAPGRTQAEVVTKLREAAALARSGEA